jgi:hypothetical protein
VNNALTFGLIFIALVLMFISYVLIQEVRAQRHWRGLVRSGDEKAIRDLVESAMAGWRSGRPPKGVAVSVWGGVQSAEVVEATSSFIRLSTAAEGQYAGVGDQRRESSSPLQEGKKIFAKLGEMALYEIPNVRFTDVQIDVYTTFREPNGEAVQHCILSGVLNRADAAKWDWDRETVDTLVQRAGARFVLDDAGKAVPFEPDALRSAPEGRSSGELQPDPATEG